MASLPAFPRMIAPSNPSNEEINTTTMAAAAAF